MATETATVVATLDPATVDPKDDNENKDQSSPPPDDGEEVTSGRRQGRSTGGLKKGIIVQQHRSDGAVPTLRRAATSTTPRTKRTTRPFTNSSTIRRGSKSDITNKTVAKFWEKTEHSYVNKQKLETNNVKQQQQQKTVTFCEEKNTVFEWELPKEDILNEIWYTQRELDHIRKDNKKNIRLKHFHSRGLEDLLNKEEDAAEKKRKEYVREVIKVYKETKARNNNNADNDDSKKENDPDHVGNMMVSHVAFTNSQACAKKAWKLAKEDETDAYHVYKKDHKKTSDGGVKFRRTASMPERAEYFVKRMKKKDFASKMATAGSNFINSAAKAAANSVK